MIVAFRLLVRQASDKVCRMLLDHRKATAQLSLPVAWQPLGGLHV